MTPLNPQIYPYIRIRFITRIIASFSSSNLTYSRDVSSVLGARKGLLGMIASCPGGAHVSGRLNWATLMDLFTCMIATEIIGNWYMSHSV